jgi:hypothetical protein
LKREAGDLGLFILTLRSKLGGPEVFWKQFGIDIEYILNARKGTN